MSLWIQHARQLPLVEILSLVKTEQDLRFVLRGRHVSGANHDPDLCNLLMNYDLYCYVQDTGLSRRTVVRLFQRWRAEGLCPYSPYSYSHHRDKTKRPPKRAVRFFEIRSFFSAMTDFRWEMVFDALVLLAIADETNTIHTNGLWEHTTHL